MRRSLLNKLNTPKALRQALVLFTLLLLPTTAWGDVTYTSTFQIGQAVGSNECTANETADNFSYNWKSFPVENSNPDISQGNYLTIVAGQSYSLVSAYRILGSVNSVIVRGSGLNDVNISYSQTPDGGNSTQIGNPSFDGETNTYTLSSVNASLNSSYLCLSFTGDNTSGGKIYSIEVTFKPVLRVGNYVFEAPGTSFDNGKIEFQIDDYNGNRILLLNNASIEGNIEWNVGYDLKLKISGINRITNIASDASSNYAIKSSGNALNIMRYSDTSTTTDALILASYTSDTHENATALITGFNNTGASPLINFENSDDNNIKYKCYTTSDNKFGLKVKGREVHNISGLVGYKEDILGDGKVSFDGTNTLTLNNATINGNIEWDMNNALTIQLTEGNTINGYISSSNEEVELSFTDPSGSKNSYLTVGKSDNTGSAIRGFNSVTLAEGLNYEEDAKYNTSEKALQNSLFSVNIPLAHISYLYGLSIYKGNEVLMNFTSRKTSFSSSDNIEGFSSGSISFDNSSKTLTLDGVTISDGIILWDHTGFSETLKIALSGNSKITCATAMKITREGSFDNPYQNLSPIISRAEVVYWETNPAPSQRENEPTLQFTSAGQGSCSLILSKSGTYNCIQGFYFPNNSPVDGTLSHAETTDNEGGGHADMLISSEFYDVWVNNIQVHGIEGYPRGYKENVTEETDGNNNPKVTYNPTDEILTLNGASITAASDYNAIESKIDNLTVHLIGTNQITCTGSSPNYAFHYSGDKTSVTVTFTTDAASPGSLDGTVDPDYMYDPNIEPKYKNGLGYTSNGSYNTIKVTEYGLKINNQQLTSAYIDTEGSIINIDGITGTVKFTPAVGSTPATLTMTNNAEISGGIFCSMESLNIALDGTSSIANINSVAIEAESTVSSTLSFIKAAGAESCKLTISGRGGAIQGFTPATYLAEGSGLYYLASENTSVVTSSVLGGGSGTSADPYLITSPDELKDFATYVNNKLVTNQYFKLTKNIDCKDLEGFESIGSSYPFMGTLSGYGNTISNLTINSGLGFFGHISGGIVNDLNFYKLSVKGNSYATGGIASELSAGGQIDNCTLTECTIACLDNQYSPEVGGIVARLSDSGSKISNCVVYNSTINASTIYTGGSGPIGYAGGIVASYSSGTITNCHVKDGSKIINVNADGGSTLKTGALVGNMSSETTTSITSNFYYYDVTVETQLGSSDKETKSGYTPRGTSDNTEDPTGAMLYTKNVIIPISTDAGHVSISSDYYYQVTSDDTNTTYSVAPDVEVVISVENADVEGSYTLDGAKTIELKPKEGSTGLYTFDMPNADVTFTVQEAAAVSFSEEGQIYVTYYNATKDVAVPMGMTAYTVTGVSEDGTKVIVSPVSYIKKGVAVLIEKDKTTEVSETTDFSGSKLIYAENDVPATTESKLYVLYQNQFVKVTSGTQIPTGKNYLDLSTFTNAGTRGFYNIGGANDGTSALRGVVAEGTNGKSDAWYTLQGRRLSTKPSAPGLYLHNGIKVVVK